MSEMPQREENMVHFTCVWWTLPPEPEVGYNTVTPANVVVYGTVG